MAGDQLDLLRFFGFHPNKDGSCGVGCLHQEWVESFLVDGIAYPTMEHFHQAAKARLFGDTDARDAVLATPYASMAKQIGSRIRGFDEHEWRRQQYDVLVAGNHAKFSTLGAPGAFLASTGSKIIVYASPADRVLGLGLPPRHHAVGIPGEWRGPNLLGFALMEVRDRLAAGGTTHV
jgi:ribA/ribD-fused uncharacterized protein